MPESEADRDGGGKRQQQGRELGEPQLGDESLAAGRLRLPGAEREPSYGSAEGEEDDGEREHGIGHGVPVAGAATEGSPV